MVQLARPLLAENRILVGSIQYQYLIERLKMSGRRYEIPEAILILESTVHSIYVETSGSLSCNLTATQGSQHETFNFVTTYGSYSVQNLKSGFLPHCLQPAVHPVKRDPLSPLAISNGKTSGCYRESGMCLADTWACMCHPTGTTPINRAFDIGVDSGRSKLTLKDDRPETLRIMFIETHQYQVNCIYSSPFLSYGSKLVYAYHIA